MLSYVAYHICDAGGFDSAVNNYESLLSLARSQGALGGQNRGACKRCGGMGHLTKQCRNTLAEDGVGPAGAAAMAAGDCLALLNYACSVA